MELNVCLVKFIWEELMLESIPDLPRVWYDICRSWAFALWIGMVRPVNQVVTTCDFFFKNNDATAKYADIYDHEMIAVYLIVSLY